MRSRTLCPSLVTNGLIPPSGSACPIDGLLHTCNYKANPKKEFIILIGKISFHQLLPPCLLNNNEHFKGLLHWKPSNYCLSWFLPWKRPFVHPLKN